MHTHRDSISKCHSNATYQQARLAYVMVAVRFWSLPLPFRTLVSFQTCKSVAAAVFTCWVLVGVEDLLKKKMSFLKHKPPYSTFSLTQDYLGKSILFLANGCAVQNSVSCMWQASSSCSLEESFCSAMAEQYQFSWHHCLSVLHDFCPASNFRNVSG